MPWHASMRNGQGPSAVNPGALGADARGGTVADDLCAVARLRGTSLDCARSAATSPEAGPPSQGNGGRDEGATCLAQIAMRDVARRLRLGERRRAVATTAALKNSIKLQLQWVPQAQFAGYFAARRQGFYEDEGLDVTILPGRG